MGVHKMPKQIRVIENRSIFFGQVMPDQRSLLDLVELRGILLALLPRTQCEIGKRYVRFSTRLYR